jgi:hypothetical protein
MITKTKLSRYCAAISLIALIYACSNIPEKELTEPETYSFKFDSSKVAQYRTVVDDLGHNGYVPFFRLFQKTNFHFDQWNISPDESIFIQDSISYYKAREVFFNQDKEFLYWLVNFKNDTIVDTTDFRRTLWSPFINPYLSSISPCSIITSKSRQAINLVYAFLDGQKIECIECHGGNQSCAVPKYEYVEEFLNKRRNLDIKELRQEWKPE